MHFLHISLRYAYYTSLYIVYVYVHKLYVQFFHSDYFLLAVEPPPSFADLHSSIMPAEFSP